MSPAASNEAAQKAACVPPALLGRTDVQLGILQLADSNWVTVAVASNEEWIRLPNRQLWGHVPAELSLESFVTRIFRYFWARPKTVIPWCPQALQALAGYTDEMAGVDGRTHSAESIGKLAALMAIVDLGVGVFGEPDRFAGWTLSVQAQHVRRAGAFLGLTSLIATSLNLANVEQGDPTSTDPMSTANSSSTLSAPSADTGGCGSSVERQTEIRTTRPAPGRATECASPRAARSASHQTGQGENCSADERLRIATRHATLKRKAVCIQSVTTDAQSASQADKTPDAAGFTAAVKTLYANMVRRCPRYFNVSLLGSRNYYLARSCHCTGTDRRELIKAALCYGERLGVWKGHEFPNRGQALYVRSEMAQLPNYLSTILPELSRLNVDVAAASAAAVDERLHHHSLGGLLRLYRNQLSAVCLGQYQRRFQDVRSANRYQLADRSRVAPVTPRHPPSAS